MRKKDIMAQLTLAPGIPFLKTKTPPSGMGLEARAVGVDGLGRPIIEQYQLRGKRSELDRMADDFIEMAEADVREALSPLNRVDFEGNEGFGLGIQLPKQRFTKRTIG